MSSNLKTTVTAVRVPNDLMNKLESNIIPLGAKNRNEVIVNALREYLEKLVQQDHAA